MFKNTQPTHRNIISYSFTLITRDDNILWFLCNAEDYAGMYLDVRKSAFFTFNLLVKRNINNEV